MSEKPILMSAEMVRAILDPDNPKTQTRRVIKDWLPKIKLPYPIRGDYPFGHHVKAEAGIYKPTSNKYGALSVSIGTEKLGIMPMAMLYNRGNVQAEPDVWRSFQRSWANPYILGRKMMEAAL
jgi:hypothetical protein